MNAVRSSYLTPLTRYLRCIFVLALSACSTGSAPSLPAVDYEPPVVSSYLPNEALRAAGIESNSSDFLAISETDPRLEQLTPDVRALTISTIYLEQWKKSDRTNSELLLRSAHFAQAGLSGAACQPDPISRCAPLNLIYAQSVRALVNEQSKQPLLSDVSTTRYHVELNGDGGSIDLREWAIAVPKSEQPTASEPGVRAGLGAPATACRVEPQPKGSYAECLPTTIVLTFENTTDAQFSRGFLTAINPSESELVRVGDQQLPLAARLSAPFFVATERASDPRLTCFGSPNPKRPTIVSIQSAQSRSQGLASAEATLSQDPGLGPVFNYCSFPLLSEADVEGDVDTLATLLSSQLAQRSTLFEKAKKADIVLISADSVSARVAGALRERLRPGRANPSSITTEHPFVIAGALALSENQSFPVVNDQGGLEETLGMRDMRRTLERIAENYPREDPSLSSSDGIDLTVSPVM